MKYRKEQKPGRMLGTSGPRDVRRRQAESTGDNALISELQRQISELRNQFTVGTGGITPEAVDAEIRKAVKDAVKETKGYYEPLLAEAKSKEQNLRDKAGSLRADLSDSLREEKDTHKKDTDKRLLELEHRYNKTISSLEDRLKIADDKVDDRDRRLEEAKSENDDTMKRMLEEHTKKLEALTKSISMEQLGVDDPDRPHMEQVFVDPLDEDAGSDLEAHITLEDTSVKQKEKMSSKVSRLKDLMGSFAKED